MIKINQTFFQHNTPLTSEIDNYGSLKKTDIL